MTDIDTTNPVEIAAAWLADQPAGNPHVVGDLKQRFAISTLQACQAIARANALRSERSKP